MDLKVKEIKGDLKKIDERLIQIQSKIEGLESEKVTLLKQQQKYKDLLKKYLPSSVGGALQDNLNEWNRKNFEWSEKVENCLKEVFHLENFRPLQKETINVTLAKQDCIVVMPTGGGKSLCFQLPSCIEEGITLVVSPLISLIEDQIWSLRHLKINAVTLNASTSKEELSQIQKEMTNKNTKLKIIYVTPEKLAHSKAFMNKLEKTYELDLLKRICIDEIHCCSSYGHDFRPDYKFLGIMKRQFPKVPILGLTATATNSVIDDVKQILKMQKCILFKSSFNRPNIYYEVRTKPSSQVECIEQISDLIKQRFKNESGIIYCFSQRECEDVAKELCNRGHKADFYHANVSAEQRSRVHQRWIKNELHIIAATIAFGMGIDKSSVKFVIHHSLSKSLENFYQESGRAGRNNELAYSVLFFRYADVFRQSSMVFTEQTGLTNLYSMVNYCIDNTVCKRKLIAQHFNDTLNELCNEMCDYCKSLAENKISNSSFDFINEAKCIIDCIDKNSTKDKRLTANKLNELAFSDISKNLKLTRNLDDGSTYTLTCFDIEKLILNMIKKEYLQEDFHFTPYNRICYIIKGEKCAKLVTVKEFQMIINVFGNNIANEEQEVTNVKVIRRNKVEQKSISIATTSTDLIVLDDDNDDDIEEDSLNFDKKKRRKIAEDE